MLERLSISDYRRSGGDNARVQVISRKDHARFSVKSSETVRQTQRWDETVRSARQRAERGRNDRARLGEASNKQERS